MIGIFKFSFELVDLSQERLEGDISKSLSLKPGQGPWDSLSSGAAFLEKIYLEKQSESE